MSNFTALAVMLAAHLVSIKVFYAGHQWIQNRSEVVLQGVSSGMPVSLRHRRMILTNTLVPTLIIQISVPGAMAFGFIGFARSVGDGFLEFFALFFAFIYGVASVGVLASSVLWFAYLRSALRDAERLRPAEDR